jgi:hypothetical protein
MPGLKAVVPDPVKRFLALHLFQKSEVDRIRAKECRVWFEETALPAMVKRGTKVLFVGVAPYTWAVLGKLRRRGALLTTIDRDPSMALWGAPRHVSASVLDPPASLIPGDFDLVCCNGLIGYGIDTEPEVALLARTMGLMAREGGLLFIGWHVPRTSLPLRDIFEAGISGGQEELQLPRFVHFPADEESFLTLVNRKRAPVPERILPVSGNET